MRKKNKYGSIQTIVDDIKFPSRLEARYYQRLKELKESGELLYFLRQVPFHLPGGVIYRVDFAEFWPDKVRYVDTKGVETNTFKTKKRIVEAMYPVKIEVVKKV